MRLKPFTLPLPPSDPFDDLRLLSITQVADLLGIGTGRVSKWFKSGVVETVQIGRSQKISVAKLREWLSSHNGRILL